MNMEIGVYSIANCPNCKKLVIPTSSGGVGYVHKEYFYEEQEVWSYTCPECNYSDIDDNWSIEEGFCNLEEKEYYT